MPETAEIVKKIFPCEHTIFRVDAKRNCHAPGGGLYCLCMSRHVVDYNAFNSWDSFGASLMLGVVPAIMNYVFTEPHDVAGSIFITVVAVLISVVVLGLSLVTRWTIIGTLVNWAGYILTPLYVCIAAYYWWFAEKPEQILPEQTTQQSISLPNQEG